MLFHTCYRPGFKKNTYLHLALLISFIITSLPLLLLLLFLLLLLLLLLLFLLLLLLFLLSRCYSC